MIDLLFCIIFVIQYNAGFDLKLLKRRRSFLSLQNVKKHFIMAILNENWLVNPSETLKHI